MGIKILGRTDLKGKKVTIKDSDGVVLKSAFGLPDDWYGGMVKEFRKIKGTELLMVLDKKCNIINIAYEDFNVLEELGLQKEEPIQEQVEIHAIEEKAPTKKK
jgi:hypothetical protein